MKYLCSRVLSGVCVLVTLLNSHYVHATDKSAVKLTPADSILPVVGGLLAILVLIFFLAGILKKFSSFNLVAKNISVIDSQSLGSKEKIVIVEIQNRQLVLGVTPHNINPLCELDKPLEKKQSHLSFDSMMKQFLAPNTGTTEHSSNQPSKMSGDS